MRWQRKYELELAYNDPDNPVHADVQELLREIEDLEFQVDPLEFQVDTLRQDLLDMEIGCYDEDD